MAKAIAPAVEWVDPATLSPDLGNPRRITPENRAKLRRLIERFGLVENLVVNTRNGELISGHQRRDLALELELAAVPVLYVDVDPAEGRALAVALNNAGAQGEWETGLLAARLEELQSLDILDLTAFSADDLAALTADDEVERVTFDVKKSKKPTITKAELASAIEQTIDSTHPPTSDQAAAIVQLLERERLLAGIRDA